jgi:hypothetical protein
MTKTVYKWCKHCKKRSRHEKMWSSFLQRLVEVCTRCR